jgi:hypothetical protein
MEKSSQIAWKIVPLRHFSRYRLSRLSKFPCNYLANCSGTCREGAMAQALGGEGGVSRRTKGLLVLVQWHPLKPHLTALLDPNLPSPYVAIILETTLHRFTRGLVSWSGRVQGVVRFLRDC